MTVANKTGDRSFKVRKGPYVPHYTGTRTACVGGNVRRKRESGERGGRAKLKVADGVPVPHAGNRSIVAVTRTVAFCSPAAFAAFVPLFAVEPVDASMPRQRAHAESLENGYRSTSSSGGSKRGLSNLKITAARPRSRLQTSCHCSKHTGQVATGPFTFPRSPSAAPSIASSSPECRASQTTQSVELNPSSELAFNAMAHIFLSQVARL